MPETTRTVDAGDARDRLLEPGPPRLVSVVPTVESQRKSPVQLAEKLTMGTKCSQTSISPLVLCWSPTYPGTIPLAVAAAAHDLTNTGHAHSQSCEKELRWCTSFAAMCELH